MWLFGRYVLRPLIFPEPTGTHIILFRGDSSETSAEAAAELWMAQHNVYQYCPKPGPERVKNKTYNSIQPVLPKHRKTMERTKRPSGGFPTCFMVGTFPSFSRLLFAQLVSRHFWAEHPSANVNLLEKNGT